MTGDRPVGKYVLLFGYGILAVMDDHWLATRAQLIGNNADAIDAWTVESPEDDISGAPFSLVTQR